MHAFTILSVFLVLGGGALAAEKVAGKGVPLFWNRRSPPPPERARGADARALTTRYTTQPLDHLGSTNATYQMRYITNDQFFKIDNSPILLMVGGEWTIDTSFVTGGHMYEIARDIGALLMYTEHRFYGRSQPVNDTSAESLEFLIVDQALADVVGLVKELKQQDRYANSKVIVFGGSYAGNMATWIRLKYPDDIDGAVASSGPVLAKADFYEYLENVNDALLSEGGQKCVDTIKEGVAKAQELLLTEKGTLQVTELFGMCTPINTTNALDVQSFFSIIPGAFSGVVQYARPGQIAAVCAPLMNENGGTPIERLANYIKSQVSPSCYYSEYTESLDYYLDTSFKDEEIFTTRLWLYQTCTQYGYYQTTTSRNQPFGDTFPLSYYQDHLCPDLYGKRFNADVLNAGVVRTNQVFGGLTPNITNIISIHGTIDPWHRLGIVEDLSEDSPAILIKGTSHCVDLQATSFLDLPALTAARAAVRASVLKWLSE